MHISQVYVIKCYFLQFILMLHQCHFILHYIITYFCTIRFFFNFLAYHLNFMLNSYLIFTIFIFQLLILEFTFIPNNFFPLLFLILNFRISMMNLIISVTSINLFKISQKIYSVLNFFLDSYSDFGLIVELKENLYLLINFLFNF